MTEPARHPDLQQLLDHVGVESYTYEPHQALDQIDEPESEAEQYRLVTVHPDAVNQYAEDMARGDQFPPAILRKVGQRLVVISGMHRIAGATKIGRATYHSYVVRCSAAEARQIAFQENRTHGVPLSPAERGEMAARLVELDGIAQADAAAEVGTTQAQVSAALARRRSLKRAQRAGVRGAERLSATGLAALARITDGSVFARAVGCAVKLNMGSSEINTLVQRVSGMGLDEAIDAILEREEAGSTRGHAGHGNRKPDHMRLTELLWALGDVDPAAVAAVAGDDPEPWHERLLVAGRRLKAIDDAVRLASREAAAA